MSFCYAINAETDNPIFLINDHIGNDEDIADAAGNILSKGEGQGIDGKIFSREFFEIDSRLPKLITYYNNSTGGDVKQGFDIFTAIIEAKSNTLSVINGFAYSTDGWVALAANKVYMYEFASWMCHSPYNPNDPNTKSPFAEMVENKLAILIAGKSGKNGKPKKTPEEIKKMMTVKTYMTAHEMYEAGLIDKILSSDNKKISPTENIKNQYKEYQTLFNKFIIKDKIETTVKNTVMYEKLLNRLKLAADSSEADILASIAGFENKINLQNAEKISMQEKIDLINSEKVDLQRKLAEAESAKNMAETNLSNKTTEYNTLKNEYDAMDVSNKDMTEKIKLHNKEKADLELQNKEDKATVLIQKHIDCGRIRNEEKLVNVWKRKATEDYEGTEAQLEAIPISMKVPIPEKLKNSDKLPSLGDGSDEAFRERNRQLRDAEAAKRK